VLQWTFIEIWRHQGGRIPTGQLKRLGVERRENFIIGRRKGVSCRVLDRHTVKLKLYAASIKSFEGV
jgi:hypothetical protein